MRKNLFALIILGVTAPVIAMEPEPEKQNVETKAKAEIELKFTIPDDKDYAFFVDWVTRQAKEQDTVFQQECYLVGPGSECADNGKGFIDAVNTVRLRSTQKGDFITQKYRHIDKQTNKTISRDELETTVKNAGVLKQMFINLGYKPYEFRKSRSTLMLHKFDHAFEVAFDEIKDGPLQSKKFIEIELKSSVTSVPEGNQVIINLLKAASLQKIVSYDRGYFQMLLNPNYDFGEVQDLSKSLSEN